MKTLKTYAKERGIQYRSAWNRFRKGKIPGAFQDEFGRILMPEDAVRDRHVVCYARVSSSENKDNLKAQAERLVRFANASGLPVKEVVCECASGLNDKRKKLHKVLNTPGVTHIVVEHKDRLTRFGFEYLKGWLSDKGCQLLVINNVETETQDLMQDFVSLVTCFSARLYGLRRSRRKTEQLIQSLEEAK